MRSKNLLFQDAILIHEEALAALPQPEVVIMAASALAANPEESAELLDNLGDTSLLQSCITLGFPMTSLAEVGLLRMVVATWRRLMREEEEVRRAAPMRPFEIHFYKTREGEVGSRVRIGSEVLESFVLHAEDDLAFVDRFYQKAVASMKKAGWPFVLTGHPSEAASA